jgi:hypothetical protein
MSGGCPTSTACWRLGIGTYELEKSTWQTAADSSANQMGAAVIGQTGPKTVAGSVSTSTCGPQRAEDLLPVRRPAGATTSGRLEVKMAQCQLLRGGQWRRGLSARDLCSKRKGESYGISHSLLPRISSQQNRWPPGLKRVAMSTPCRSRAKWVALTASIAAPRSSNELKTAERAVSTNRAGSQPGHNLPESAASSGSPKDTSLVGFVYARTTRESVGHLRTRH